MNRRTFLHTLGAIALFSTTTKLATAARRRKASSEAIIVVGAGIAGLAAARELAAAGYRVTVLEGRDRIGGRVWTSQRWADAPLDLGASWIHGTEENPITDLADTIGAKRVITSYDAALLYETNGQPAGAGREAEIERWQKKVDQAIVKAQRGKADRSLQAAVEQAVDWPNLSTRARQTLEFILNSTIEHEYAGDVTQLSAKFFDDGEAFDGEDVLFPGGYGVIADYLAQDLTIHLKHRVTQIAYDQRGVTVTTDQGLFQADRVVVTLPLGVLQKNVVRFNPALPAAKVAAINALGMGLLNKLYLRFPTPFWPTDYDWLEYLPAEKGQWAEWVSLYRPTNVPILLGFNAATFGRTIETWSDAQIVESALTTLRTIFGKKIPAPTGWQLTRWAADPFAYGSYSYYAVGSNRQTRAALARPVAGRLFFAGEATETDYPATVHGAYLSGLRATEEITEEIMEA